MEFPQLPAPVERFLQYSAQFKTQAELRKATEPFIQYESKLREVFAQHPDHAAAQREHLIPVFQADNPQPIIRARDPSKETPQIHDQYLLALSTKDRKADESQAIVNHIAEFKTNFNLFSESSLVDLDWSNVIAAGSSVVTALLPVAAPHNESKRALRAYYHQTLAPASDVDLFIYGLDEEQAIEKIKTIEQAVRDSILSETTTIRTKNAITIVSEYPTRHVQIVLRLYKNITEVLTGFDVDCSGVAYDGKQVLATPRAMAAFMTQINGIDLTRRSPSYENRLSKYSHRGFEVHWPVIDRARIDPTIYERSFSRVLGLARLLVLEKLPHPNDRDTYLAKRREERDRPALPWNARYRHALPGNVKDSQPDDVAEWVEESETSNYNTFTVPYGPKYNAKRIEKILFTKDLLLNAEWNRPKDRETKLHRHPAFFGSVGDVIHDCCGFCPKPETDEDLAAFEEESKLYISGDVEFLKDNPGRQTIGSFHPLTDDDWTEQAYVGNTTILCQAIVDKDLEGVIDWFSNGELESVDVNRRDHAGRTPLQLATMCSTPEIVEYLIDHGARIVSRLYNGLTALHIAAYRGQTEMVQALLERSSANEAIQDQKEDVRRSTRRAAAEANNDSEEIKSADSESDSDMDETDEEDTSDEMTEGSFVKVKPEEKNDEDEDEPDVYDVDVLAWDSPLSPLHLAVIAGKLKVVDLLVQKYGADVLLPVKILSSLDRQPEAAILTLVLALKQPLAEARKMIGCLISNGAITTQADMNGVSALHFAIKDAKQEIVRALTERTDPNVLKKALNHVSMTKIRYYSTNIEAPLLTAVHTGKVELVSHLLRLGAQPQVDFEGFAKVWSSHRSFLSPEDVRKDFGKNVEQPLVVAVQLELPEIAMKLVEAGADINVCPRAAHELLGGRTWDGGNNSLLDLVDKQIKKLSDYIDEQSKDSVKPEAPAPLDADDSYTNYPQDSYRLWTAINNLEQAKEVRKYQMEQYKKALEDFSSREIQFPEEKRVAVVKVRAKLEALKETLLKNGAKSFRELFPKAPEPDPLRQYRSYDDRNRDGPNEPYKTTFWFNDSAATDAKKELYIKLFEAAWTGDIDTVKQLTLDSMQPLAIAIRDQAGFSPFSIAVIRGHNQLARVILEISTVQYKPSDNEPKYRYFLGAREDDSDVSDDSSEVSGGASDEPHVFAEIVDDRFTIDNIATLGDTVKSKVSPVAMVEWNAQWWRAHQGQAKLVKASYGFPDKSYYCYRVVPNSWDYLQAAFSQEGTRCTSSPIRHAIVKNDIELLKFFIQVGKDLMARQETPEGISGIYNIPSGDFDFAMSLGRIEMVGEIITTSGAAIPLQAMVKQSGIQLDEKPQYYQGLTVHGRKREDWAAKGQHNHGGTGRGTKSKTEIDHSLVLRSIFQGNLDSAEFFLSDAPLRRYMEFAERYKTDKRIQSLSQAKGGIEGALSSWLGIRSDLALHVAVMCAPTEAGTSPMFDYILKAMPHTIEVKDDSGNTPLHTAVRLRRMNIVKALLEAGANQLARNSQGESVLHMILGDSSYSIPDPDLLDAAIQLFDPKLVNGMFVEKSSVSEPSKTPLALLLNANTRRDTALKACRVVFRHSKGQDLEVLDGAGDYVIHTLVRSAQEHLVKSLIEYRPEMLYWENATGMTPIDVAETRYLRNLIDDPPSLSNTQRQSVTQQPAASFQLHRERTEDDRANDALNTFIAGEEKGDIAERNSVWRMHHLMKKLAEKYPGKRKLVSVLDANEVAKRLAIQQQKRNEETRRQERLGLHATGMQTRERYGEEYGRRGRRWGELEEGGDEVKRWWNEAAGKRKWDWEKWSAEVLGKEFEGAKRSKGEE